MHKNEIDKFRMILKAKQLELASQLQRRDGMVIEKTADAFDEVQRAAERELVTRNLERESKVQRDVGAALVRVEQGTYGTCVKCDEEISTKRLNAVPWASLCIACQEQADDQQVGSGSQSALAA